MNSKNLLSLLSIAVLATAVFITSCSKREFDQPPIGGDIVTNVVANYTIAELKAAHVVGKIDSIKTDLILKGVVIADDESGNFYKQLFIQDATGGIELLVNGTSLYAEYPIGREVYVKLNGLVVGDYQGLPQIGGYVFVSNGSPSVEGIVAAKIGNHLLKGERGKFVTPKTKTINALTTADYQTLITLPEVQFNKVDTGLPYADYIGKKSTNRTIEDCSGAKAPLYSSGFATFASLPVSAKKGTMTCVALVYSNKPEFLIRDLNDLNLTEARCGVFTGTCNPGLVNESFTSQPAGADVAAPCWLNWSPVSGGRVWSVKSFSGNNFAECEAYQDPKPNTEAWLITPPISLASQRTLTFTTQMAFWKHAGLTVLFSTNFDGTNVVAATWTPLSATLASSPTNANYDEISSGNVILPASATSGYVAFKYVGTAAANTTKFRLDNVIVQ